MTNLAEQPVLRIERLEQFFQVGDAFGRAIGFDFQIGRLNAIHRLAIVVGRLLGEHFVAAQGVGKLSFLDQRGGDVFQHARVVGKQVFQPFPNGQGFFDALGLLMHAPQGLEDRQQIGLHRLAFDGRFESHDGLVRLPNQD